MSQKRGRRTVLTCLLTIAIVLGSAIAFAAAGIGLVLVSERRVRGSWEQAPKPPEPLAGFVANTPTSYFGEDVYATTAGGALYALTCDYQACSWARREALPPPADESMVFDGPCPDGDNTPDSSIRKPRAPGKVVSSYGSTYCGPDYQEYSFYLLLDDGSVWTWGTGVYPISTFHGMVALGLMGLIVGLAIGVVAAIIVGVARSRRGRRKEREVGGEAGQD